MNKTILTYILILICSLSFSQDKNCGPHGLGLENKRINIMDGKELTSPYNGIIHLKIKRLFSRSNLSTASFIKNDLIITANHNVMCSPFITRIEIFVNNKWIKLKKRNVRIYHYHQGIFHNRNKDIAIIKIKNVSVLEGLNITNFNIKPYASIPTNEKNDFHTTGFPSDRPNILVDKSGSSSEFVLDNSNNIIGYNNLYTCKGDSGAPLWYQSDNKFYLLGIHHGKKNIKKEQNTTMNSSILITPQVEKWIFDKYN
ncbi:trypsin-like serine protease [Seonamhaeicola sp. NFXS20]|uniref:trypsin-like serine peptidase n=1 Tax=Seonamhaeicola sp. NFXS20 TaxID=2816959 RepID=UPI003B8B0683